VRFISEHKTRFGVEPICRVLTEHGVPIAPSTYYDAIGRGRSARSLRDEQLKAAISRVHGENYAASLIARTPPMRSATIPPDWRPTQPPSPRKEPT
jgi:hypothetical protein